MAGNEDRAEFPEEHRRAMRYPSRPTVVCEVLGPSAELVCSAWPRNISATGICLVIQRQFVVGSLLTVAFRSNQGAAIRRKNVRVIHSNICCPNDSWMHGCAFTEELTQAELLELSSLEMATPEP